MKTKQVIVTIALLIAGHHTYAQQMTVQQTHLAGLKADSLQVAGLTAWIEFCLKQDTILLNAGTADLKEATNTLSNMIKNGTSVTDQVAKFYVMGIQADESMISLYVSLYGSSYSKDEIMDEKAEDRKKKVTWNDQEYKLTSNSKERFKTLGGYLETVQKKQETDQKNYKKLYL